MLIEKEIGFVVTGGTQRGVGRGIGRIWSKGTNFQSTTQPGPPGLCPQPRSRRSPGAETLSPRPPPAHQRREPETPGGARRAQLPPPARWPVSRRILPSMGSPETCAPAGDPSAPEGHTPAAKKDPLLPPATLSSNQPPVPSPAPRDCLLLSHLRDQESRARRL